MSPSSYVSPLEPLPRISSSTSSRSSALKIISIINIINIIDINIIIIIIIIIIHINISSIGWSDNHFNNLHFNKSQHINECSAARVIIYVVSS